MAFKICKKGTCGISVTDLNNDDYQLVSMITISGNIYYTFLESATVNALISVSYADERTLRTYQINTHEVVTNDTTGEETYVTDESIFQFEVDGLHEITHIILPTQEYVEKFQDSVHTYFPGGVYYTDGEKVYQFLEDLTSEEIDIETLLEVNPCDTTIIKETKGTFSICHLEECFANICKALLSKLCNERCDVTSKYAQDIFNRDLVWMTINVIKYCIEIGQYYEAQRFLENLIGCGNICADYISGNGKKGSGCGCSN